MWNENGDKDQRELAAATWENKLRQRQMCTREVSTATTSNGNAYQAILLDDAELGSEIPLVLA